ncbi:MAG: MFS transporter [Anaerolineae bacterium]|nr:MFS transporter [Anaerolineae bacterium]
MWRNPLDSLRIKLKVLEGEAERNAFYLYAEVAFASVLSAAASFNSAYILRAGGSNTLVGLLSSLPSLLAVFLFIPAARVLEKKKNYLPWVLGSLSLARCGYLAILILPFFLSKHIPEATVGVLVAMTIPSVFFSTGWSPLLSDVIPPRSRATVLAWRSILSSATAAPLVYLFGRWLDGGTFPSNYQRMYAVGLLGGAISVILISRIHIPETEKEPAPQTQAPKLPWKQALRAMTQENRYFIRIITNTLVFNLGAWLVAPLYIILFIRHLGATDSWIGLNRTLANVGVVIGYWLWRRFIHKMGEQRALLLALPLASAYAFMVALVPNLTFILLAGFLINLILPGVSLSHSVIFLNLLPPGKKHVLTAVYSTVMNIGAFAGPLIGVALSEHIGILPTLVIGGILRFTGAMLFYFRPVQEGMSPRLLIEMLQQLWAHICKRLRAKQGGQ